MESPSSGTPEVEATHTINPSIRKMAEMFGGHIGSVASDKALGSKSPRCAEDAQEPSGVSKAAIKNPSGTNDMYPSNSVHASDAVEQDVAKAQPGSSVPPMSSLNESVMYKSVVRVLGFKDHTPLSAHEESADAIHSNERPVPRSTPVPSVQEENKIFSYAGMYTNVAQVLGFQQASTMSEATESTPVAPKSTPSVVADSTPPSGSTESSVESAVESIHTTADITEETAVSEPTKPDLDIQEAVSTDANKVSMSLSMYASVSEVLGFHKSSASESSEPTANVPEAASNVTTEVTTISEPTEPSPVQPAVESSDAVEEITEETTVPESIEPILNVHEATSTDTTQVSMSLSMYANVSEVLGFHKPSTFESTEPIPSAPGTVSSVVAEASNTSDSMGLSPVVSMTASSASDNSPSFEPDTFELEKETPSYKASPPLKTQDSYMDAGLSFSEHIPIADPPSVSLDEEDEYSSYCSTSPRSSNQSGKMDTYVPQGSPPNGFEAMLDDQSSISSYHSDRRSSMESGDSQLSSPKVIVQEVDQEVSPVSEVEEDEYASELGTPLHDGGKEDLDYDDEDEDDYFSSHRFIGPSNPKDPWSSRQLHGIRRVSVRSSPPKFVSDAATGSQRRTSASAASTRRSSASEHTFSVAFAEPKLGMFVKVVLDNDELSVQVAKVDRHSPAFRAGVVVGDILVSVNGTRIEPHMPEPQVQEIIASAKSPRNMVFLRQAEDRHDSYTRSSDASSESEAPTGLYRRLSSAVSFGSSVLGSALRRRKTFVHEDSECSSCGMSPITGALWTCSSCSDTTLCNSCYESGAHGMEGSEAMLAMQEATAEYKIRQKCKSFTPELMQSLRMDVCKDRPDKLEYLGEWIGAIIGGTPANQITVRGCEIPNLTSVGRQRFVTNLLPLVSNRTDIEVHVEWLIDNKSEVPSDVFYEQEDYNAFADEEEEEPVEEEREHLEKLRIWISDKKLRTASPFMD